jgi:hypothetical protein
VPADAEGGAVMPLDLAFVLLVAIAAIALNPDTEPTLHRLELAFRLWRNGYSWHAAWHLAERH